MSDYKPYSLSDPVSSDIWALRRSRLIPNYLYWIFKIRGLLVDCNCLCALPNE